MTRATQATWVKRLEDWEQSGLDVVAFAEKVGVTARTLRWWRWKLGTKGSARKPKSMTVRREAVTPLTFVEMTDVARSEPIEIVLRNEIRVRVGAAFDGATLGRVLDVLERR